MLLGAASYAVGYTYAGRKLVNTGATSTQLAAMQLTTAMGLLVLAVPFGGLQPVHLHWVGIVAVTILGVFGTGAAFILNYRVIADEVLRRQLRSVTFCPWFRYSLERSSSESNSTQGSSQACWWFFWVSR